MFTVRRALVVLSVAGAGMLSASIAGAQGMRARSDALTGCWRATSGAAMNGFGVSSAPLVCVLPTGSDSLTFTTIANGKVASTSRLDVSGRDAEFSESGCKGTQNAKWSTDGRRLYTHSASVCSGGLQRNTSGLYALTTSGEWLDIQAVSAGEGNDVRVIRYRDVPLNTNAMIPAEIVSALNNRGTAVLAARLSAGSAVSTSDVLETSKAVSPSVAEAWILERHQRFPLNADQLVQLADQGIPGPVIDAMVASSYPSTFNVAHVDAAEGEMAAIDLVADTVYAPRRHAAYMNPWAFSPYGYGGYYGVPYGAWDYYEPDYFGWGNYGYGYGYGSYGYGYGFGSPFFYGGYGAYGYAPPVIIVNGGSGSGGNAHVVKGKGYTQGSAPANTGSRAPAPSTSGSSGAAASTTRTAKPKSP